MDKDPESNTLNTKLKELGEMAAEELNRYQEKRSHTIAGKAINMAKGLIGKVKGLFGGGAGRITAEQAAEAGYNAYGARAGWKIHDGSKSMPTWGQLGAEVQARWCAAAVEMAHKMGVNLAK